MASHTVIISHAIVVHDVPDHSTKATGSGEGECTCGWKSAHYAHDRDLSAALDVHDQSHYDHTGRLVKEILHTVIRDRTSLDSVQVIVQEARRSRDHEVHLANQNDIDDPPHLPAFQNMDGTILVTLVNNEQEALVATRSNTADRWRSPHYLYITRD